MADKTPEDIVRFNQGFEYLKGEKIVADKRDFAAKLGYSYSHIASISNGNKELPEKIAKRLEELYGISAAWVKYGKGDMRASLKSNPAGSKYLSYNTIYHFAPEKVGLLSKEAISDKQIASLERWCMPGLKGEYISVSLEGKGLDPDYPKGSLLVLKEIEQPYGLAVDNVYLFLKTDKSLFLGKVAGIKNDTYKLNTGQLSSAEVLKCYAIVLGVPPAKR